MELSHTVEANPSAEDCFCWMLSCMCCIARLSSADMMASAVLVGTMKPVLVGSGEIQAKLSGGMCSTGIPVWQQHSCPSPVLAFPCPASEKGLQIVLLLPFAVRTLLTASDPHRRSASSWQPAACFLSKAIVPVFLTHVNHIA